MIYLSRLFLNPRERAVRRDLADCHQLHRTIMSAFGQVESEAARAEFGVLYRVEEDPRSGRVTVLVQSLAEPDWSRLPQRYLEPSSSCENPAVKRIDKHYAQLAEGMMLRFRLVANPSKKIAAGAGPDGSKRNSKRVELRSDEERLAWLARKGQQAGFALVSVRANAQVSATQAIRGDKLTGLRLLDAGNGAARRERVTVAPVRFDGLLRITDVERFQDALRMGIGPAKAYGMGLLSIASVG